MALYGGGRAVGYAFICISQEVRTWKYDWRASIWEMIFFSDREPFTRTILSRNWIAFISLVKARTSLFTSVSKKRVFTLFKNVWMSSIYRGLDDVFCQFPGSTALSELRWSQKHTASTLPILFGVPFLTLPASAGPHISESPLSPSLCDSAAHCFAILHSISNLIEVQMGAWASRYPKIHIFHECFPLEVCGQSQHIIIPLSLCFNV